MKKNHQFLKQILIYTGLFAIGILYLIYFFEKYQKSFIYNVDALQQHIGTLKYFREMLIACVKGGGLSTFTWYIGNGMNLFGNLSYYILGDVFSYFSVLVPTNKVELLYSVLIFVRLYCVGLSFLAFCQYRKINWLGSVIGALMYTFCSAAIYPVLQHPYFINALILFPLLMIGMEKIIVENKFVFYTIMITIMFLNNFYFGFMMAIVLALYGTTLAICTYRKNGGIKKVITKLVQVLLYSFLGIMMAAILLLPTIIEFLNSERSGSGTILPYAIGYYRNIFRNMLSMKANGGYWNFWGVQSIILIALPSMIRRKSNKPMLYVLLLLMLPLLSAKVNSILCGFSHPNGRWLFIVSFIFSYLTAEMIHHSIELDKKDIMVVFSFILVYIGINYIFDIAITPSIIIQIVIAIVIFLLMLNREKIETKLQRFNLYHILLVTTFMIGILSSIYYLCGVGNDTANYLAGFIGKGEFNKITKTSNHAIKDFEKAVKYIQEKDKGFYHISKYPYSYDNLPLIKRYKAMGSYYSITPHYYHEICMDLQNPQYSMSFGMKEFDYRTKISTLLGGKYYIKKGKNTVPYGYQKIEDYKGKSEIYVNQYALPFAVLYDNYITEADYQNMNPLEKESSLLKTTVLQKEKKEIRYHQTVEQEIKKDVIHEVGYEIIDKHGIVKDNKVIVEDKEKNEIQLRIDETSNSEIYLYVNSIRYTPYMKEELIEKELADIQSKDVHANIKIEQEKLKKKYKWYQPSYSCNIDAHFKGKTNSKVIRDYITSPYYFKNDEMLFNLGYYDKTSGNIVLRFSKTGIYDFSTIQILAVSMDDYENDINKLKESNFEVTSYGNGYMKGTANPAKDGILQFSTFYNKGWKVYVDNKKVETFESNNYFLGIDIIKGKHTIYMKYEVPYLKEGIVISMIGVILFIGCIMINRKKLVTQVEKKK